ncbi:MAG: PAS domain S-box protein [Sandaracinus sp.]|nr:PAS domain S-box protein [Sandaracinus sp.]
MLSAMARSKVSADTGKLFALKPPTLLVELTRNLAGGALEDIVRHLFADLDEAVVVADADRRIVHANRAMLDLFGYPMGELLGRTTRRLYADGADFEAVGNERFFAAGPSNHERYVMRYRRRDGSTFLGATVAGPFKNDEGETVGFLGIITDVSAPIAETRLLRQLHAITSDRKVSFEGRVAALVRLAAQHFGMPLGMLGRIVGDDYEVVRTYGGPVLSGEGSTLPLERLYCSFAWARQDVVALEHIGRSSHRCAPCYSDARLESYIGVPVLVDGRPWGTLACIGHVPRAAFTERDKELVRLIATWIGHEVARETDHRKLHDLALRDPLTGVSNRRATQGRLERAIVAHPTTTVILIDLDHFKAVNDTLGHDVGDQVLHKVSEVASGALRDADLFGRWGGEEFLVVLPNADLGEGAAIARRLGQVIREASVHTTGRDVHVTASMGVAATRPSDTPGALLRRADEAVYRAKARGRDRVELETPPDA